VPRLALVVHSYFDEDPRVRRAATAAVAAGWSVDVIALRRPADESEGELDGARVYRIPISRRQGAGITTYVAEYARFAFAATRLLQKLDRAGRQGAEGARRGPIDLVHVSSVPDWLVVAGTALRRRTGARVVLDLHEASPEFFRMRFGGPDRSIAARLLARLLFGLVAWAERASVRAADWTLVTTPRMLARLQRLVPDRAQTMEVVLNVPSLSRFHSADGASSSTWMEGGVLRLFYGGALTPTYELNVIFRAIAILTTGSTPVPVHLTIAGRGESESPLRHLAANLGIAANVTFLGRIEMNDMPALIAACDIALAPTRRDEFTDLTISNKVYEGLAMGKIVLASQLDTLEDLIPTNVALRYESGNAGSAAEAIRSVVENPEAREARRRAGLSLIGAGANWEAAGSAYVQRLSALIAVSPAR